MTLLLKRWGITRHNVQGTYVMRERVASLRYVFYPRNVAIIGASRDPNKPGSVILKNVLEGPSGIEVYPVNPKAEEIMGLRCYPTVLDVPDGVDLAVIAIPAPLVPGAMKDCITKGVKAAIIISAGFGETESGKALQDELERVVHEGRTRVLGPNTFGVMMPGRINTVFYPYDKSTSPRPGNVAFITQSGAMGFLLLEKMAYYRIGISAFVSIGNKIDVDENDLIEFLIDDDSTKSIACYLESFRDGREFFEISRRVARRKPIVLLKSGVTERGARAAASHTGALAGSSAVLEGALRQAGVIGAHDEEELIDFAVALAYGKPLKGGRVAVITSAGGVAVTATDRIENTPGLKMAELSEETKDGIKTILPPFASTANPIDITATSTPEMVDGVLEELQKDDNVDVVLVFSLPQPPLPVTEELVDVITKWFRKGKPLVVGTIENRFTIDSIRTYNQRGVPVFPSITRAVKALKVLRERGRYLEASR